LDEPYKREHPTNAQLCHPSFISNLLEMNRLSTFTITILVLSLLFSGLHCRQNQAVYEDNALSLFLNTIPSNGGSYYDLVDTLTSTKLAGNLVAIPGYKDYILAVTLGCNTLAKTLEEVKSNADSSTKQKILQDITELASTINFPLDASKACEYLNQVSNHIVNDNYEEVTELKATTGAFVNSQTDILPYISELTLFYEFLRSLSNKVEKDADLMKRIYDLLYQAKNNTQSFDVIKSKMSDLLNEMLSMERAKPCSQYIETLIKSFDDPFNMGHFCDYLGGLLSYMVRKFEMNRLQTASIKN